jgi:hypothetical protein
MHITHPYNQAKDDRWRSDEETSEGACFGLSVWWIIKNAESANYWEWMRGEEGQVDTADEMTQELGEIVEFYRIKEAKISKSPFVLLS